MLWIILTLMTLAMAAYVALPFLGLVRRSAGEGASGVALLRDQLAEIDREQAAGVIETKAAEAARIEVKRRLLAAEKSAATSATANPLGAVELKFVLGSILGLTVLGSAILYTAIGSPGLSSAVRMQGAKPGPSASTEPIMDVDAAIAGLVERLKQKPDDVRGWTMLGWSYMGTGRYAQAIEAYRKADALDPKNANIKSGLSQALIRAADGKVTPEAMSVLDQVLALDPKEPGARFDKGLAKLQAGDAKGALDDWIAQLKDAGPGDVWVLELRQRVIETAAEAKIDVSGRLPAVAPAAGPTAADIEAAKAMPEGDRKAMIEGMVARLAAKLDAEPKNPEGWEQLMRSYTVLGDKAAAKAALGRALAVFKDDKVMTGRMNSAADQLGIE